MEKKFAKSIKRIRPNSAMNRRSALAGMLARTCKQVAKEKNISLNELVDETCEFIESTKTVSFNTPNVVASKMSSEGTASKEKSEKPLSQMNKAELVQVALTIDGNTMTEETLKEMKNAELIEWIEAPIK